MALALKIPLIAVNHMQAHILAHFIDSDSQQKPEFPFICLTISGGHTQLIKVTDYFSMEILGETIDDAVGEAFDKAAKKGVVHRRTAARKVSRLTKLKNSASS